MTKEKEQKEIEEPQIVVVGELPKVEVDIGLDENKKKIQFMTKEQAMTEILRILKRLDKAL